MEFADTIAVHDIRAESSDADYRNGRFDPRIHSREPHRLIATTTGSGSPNPFGIYLR
ncbi:hypothetical protein D3C81_2296450 [compost metagenome]